MSNSSRDEKIVAQYMLLYVYKIFRLIIIAIIITYFIGCFWFYFCTLYKDVDGDKSFIHYNSLIDKGETYQVVVSCYFALTTLSTVGYGDYYPISNNERIFAVVIMLCGVAFFSYIMGNFVEIVDSYGTLTNELEDGEQLTKFFGLLTQFNRGVTLNQKFKEDIERYFDYMWENNRNWAVIEEDDQMILEQLPTECIVSIFKDFLFVQFLKTFRKSFVFKNYTSKHSHAFFNWDHAFY